MDSRPKAADHHHDHEHDDFTDELIEKIEILTNEKLTLAAKLEEADMIRLGLQKQLEQDSSVAGNVPSQEANPDVHKKCELERHQLAVKISQLESSLKEMSDSHEDQLSAIREDKARAMEDLTQRHSAEVEAMRNSLDQKKHEMEQRQMALESSKLSEVNERLAVQEKLTVEKADQLARVQKQLDESLEITRARENELNGAHAKLSTLEESEVLLRRELIEFGDRVQMLKQDMGQNVEKLCTLEEKCKSVEKERDDLKRKCKEIEAKMDVMTRAVAKDTDEKVKQLEKALEEALVEREEILEACEKEIQHEKTIAIETEQKMMDDFEWKLREIEAEYRNKIREVETRAKTEQEEYAKKKDEDLTRMSISLRREKEDQIRIERSSLKQALEAQHVADRERALEAFRMESARELRVLQASWDEEKSRLDREVRTLKRRIEELDKEATRRRAEIDYLVTEEKRKSEVAQQKLRQDLEDFRQRSEDQMEQVRSEYEQKIAGYESRLDAANETRMSSMFSMREEVETEFTERMEQLRNMYMTEIESQAGKMEEEKARANRTEVSLRQMLSERQGELDELNTYYSQQGDDYDAKINELLTRLQEQTTLAVKLQAEIDEYEWYEEEEEGGAAGGDAGGGDDEEDKRTHTPRRPPSRPPSTRPAEQNRIPEPEITISRASPQLMSRQATSSVASLASTASYATPTGHNEGVNVTAATPDSLQSFASNSSSPSQPEPPPRTSNRRSWNPDAPDSPQPQHTYASHLRYLYL